MKQNYIENGYFLSKNFLNNKKINKIKNDISLVFECLPKELDEKCIELFKNNFELYLRSASVCSQLLSVFNAFSNEHMQNTLKLLGIKNPSYSTCPIIQFSSPKTSKKEIYWKVPPHQDWTSNQGSINGITCWCPLQNTKIELGALEIVPNSHFLGPMEHCYQDIPIMKSSTQYNFVPIEMEQGDMLFFNTFLIHRSGINTTDKIRFSIAARYNDLEEPSFRKRNYPKTPKKEERKIDTKFPTIDQIKQVLQDYHDT